MCRMDQCKDAAFEFGITRGLVPAATYHDTHRGDRKYVMKRVSRDIRKDFSTVSIENFWEKSKNEVNAATGEL